MKFSGFSKMHTNKLFSFGSLALLHPKGIIALGEYNMAMYVTLVLTCVTLAVFICTFFIVWKYRASNTKENIKEHAYEPDWNSNIIIESLWWIIPSLIIALLSVNTWRTTHNLDPYKTLDSTAQPIVIQVIALDWKWLFIYPDQHIATINFVEFPAGTPVTFKLTADAPMNTFWIPQLGGQMYAMAGMETQIHLQAFTPGDYAGSSAELDGKGFAGMRFTARAVSQEDFDGWVHSIRMGAHYLDSENDLDTTEYTQLSSPSTNVPVVFYSNIDKNLYNSVMQSFMTPSTTTHAVFLESPKTEATTSSEDSSGLTMPSMQTMSM
jgi:cytochrome o ubiquinol oxidase subunit 2